MSGEIGTLDDALRAVDRLTRELVEGGVKLPDHRRATILVELERAIARAEAVAHAAIGVEVSAELRRRYDDLRAAAGAASAADAAPSTSLAQDADTDRATPGAPARPERRRAARRDTGPQTPVALRRALHAGGERAVIGDGAAARGIDESERR